MPRKRPFLLARSVLVDRASGNWLYDQAEQLNVQITSVGLQPVTMTELATTSSKTFAEPGDDDPDVDAEKCY